MSGVGLAQRNLMQANADGRLSDQGYLQQTEQLGKNGLIAAGVGLAISLSLISGIGEEAAPAEMRTVVIGRNMEERVIPYAERHGLEYYHGTPKWVPNGLRRAAPKTLHKIDLWFDRRWINSEIRAGSRFIDIGESRGLPPSDFYNMEREQLNEYLNYTQAIQP